MPETKQRRTEPHEEKSPPTKAFAPMADYTSEETEWLKACERARRSLRNQGRSTLTLQELLGVALGMGYRKLSPEAAQMFDEQKRAGT